MSLKPVPTVRPEDPARQGAYGITPDNYKWLEGAPPNSTGAVKPRQGESFGGWAPPSILAFERAYAAGNAVPELPGEQPSDYWLDPHRVARYYNILQAAPDDYQIPDWMDRAQIEDAYKYLEMRNEGKPWYQWQALPDDDPGIELLRSMKLPPREETPERDWKFFDQKEQKGLDPMYTMPNVDGKHGLTDEQFNALPEWQQIAIPLLSSGGWKAGAAMGFATSAPIGLIAGATATPLAGLATVGVGAVLGGLLGGLGEIVPALQKVFGAFDVLAEGAERTIGVGRQLYGAATDSEKYGSVMEVVNNLDAAWRAATFSYDILPGEVSGTAVQLGTPEPVKLTPDRIGLAALVAARHDINEILEGRSNETLEDLYQRYRDDLGFAGMAADTLGHMVLDPLNLLGMGGKGGIKVLARRSGNADLVKAVEMSGKAGISQIPKMYKILLDQKPLDDIAKMGKLSKLIAGVGTDAAGKPYYKFLDNKPTIYDKGLGKMLRYIPGANIPWLASLDPRSKATEVTFGAVDNMMISMVDLNIDDTQKMIHAVSKINPQQAADVSAMGWMQGKYGAIFPLAVREIVPQIDEMIDSGWRIPTKQRELMHSMAEALDTDLSSLMKSIDIDGDPNLAYRTLRNRLEEATNPAAKQVLATLDDTADPVTARKLVQYVDNFRKGIWDLTEDSAKARILVKIGDGIENWATKFYGVKPMGLINRMADTVKKAQSLLLLGMNPNYMFNNLFDNATTMAYSGVFGTMTPATRDHFWNKRMGFEPLRRKQGVTAAEVETLTANTYAPGKIIKAAATKEGKLNDIGEMMSKASDKLGLFTKLSAEIESHSSDIAYTTAASRLMQKNWRAGRGYDKLPSQMEARLRAVGIDPDIDIYPSINASYNAQELEAKLWSKTAKYALEKVATPDEMEILHSAGVDNLLVKIPEATSFAEVKTIFNDAREVMRKNVDAEIAKNLKYAKSKSMTKALNEGFLGAMSEFDEVAETRSLHWNNHYNELEKAWAEFNRLKSDGDFDAADNFLSRQLRRLDQDWRRQNEAERAKLAGVIEAFGGDSGKIDARSAEVLRYATDIQKSWEEFSTFKRGLWDNFFAVKGKSRETAAIALKEDLIKVLGIDAEMMLASAPSSELRSVYADLIREATKKMYIETVDFELTTASKMDDLFGNMFEARYPASLQAVETWRLGKRETRQQMVAANLYFRDKTELSGLNPEVWLPLKQRIDEILLDATLDNNGTWRRYIDEVYRPMINELPSANRQAANDMYMAAMREQSVGAPYDPIIDVNDYYNNVNALKDWHDQTAADMAKMDASGNLRRSSKSVDYKPVEPQDPGVAPSMVNNMLGSTDQLHQPPVAEMQNEMWVDRIRPLLDSLEQRYANVDTNMPSGVLEKLSANGVPEQEVKNLMRELRAYQGQVETQLKDMKYVATKWGESQRDFALLNYSRRTNFDNMMSVVFPYEFWMTHAGLNWIMRAADKPAMLANFGRLKEFQETTVNRPGFPTRLRKKIAIDIPFLPDWMGDSIYIDPIRRIFPFTNFLEPLYKIEEQNNLVNKKMETIFMQMISDNEIDKKDAITAVESKSGALWDKVKAKAMEEADAEITNPFDVMTLLYGPSLPVQWGYQWLSGRKDSISQLPMSRTIQNATVALGIGGPAGINIEAPIRKALGLPEVDKYYDYRVDRMLSNMTAEGLIDPDTAVMAMMERKGEAYDTARARVAKEGLWKSVGAPLSLDFFPEGEQHQRGLRDKYAAAWEAYDKGDEEAVNAFFEQHPEYDAQLAAWREPEERLRRFLRSQIWEGYNELEGPNKSIMRENLGDLFNNAFLNKETCSYDSIDTQTLALWAAALSKDVPTVPSMIESVQPKDVIRIVNPETGSKLLPASQNAAVQAYWDEREKLFPGLKRVEEVYYGLPKDMRKQMLATYPKLQEMWDWGKTYKMYHPEVKDYLDQQKLDINRQNINVMLADIDEAMLRQLAANAYGYPLTGGAKEYFMRYWKKNGKPFGDFNKYLEEVTGVMLSNS